MKKTFYINVPTYSRFTHIREYLMKKYQVYTAIFHNGYAEFRVAY